MVKLSVALPNRQFHHTAYRQFVVWQHGALGQVREMLYTVAVFGRYVTITLIHMDSIRGLTCNNMLAHSVFLLTHRKSKRLYLLFCNYSLFCMFEYILENVCIVCVYAQLLHMPSVSFREGIPHSSYT